MEDIATALRQGTSSGKLERPHSASTQHNRTVSSPALASSPSMTTSTPAPPAIRPKSSSRPTSPPTSPLPPNARPPTSPVNRPAIPERPQLAALARSSLELPPPNPRSLLKLAGGVVSSRNGSVLSRGFILKSDTRPSLPSDDDSSSGSERINLRGAVNFRMAELGVFGVAQPTEGGLRTILSFLRSQPVADGKGKELGRETVWFCTREEPVVYLGSQPFVLRDAKHPTRTYPVSDRAENLEGIEKRLKQDILKEATRYGGLISVQEELSDGSIIATWIAADSVRTVRELWEEMRAEGYNVAYHRVPVTQDQSPEDGYLDIYSSILATVPTSSSLVFNCGAGVKRTTFAMSVALIVRRKQMISEGKRDPYAGVLEDAFGKGDETMQMVLRERSEQATRDRSLLGLMSVLQKSLATSGQSAVLSLLSGHPQLLENLRTALLGQYDLILSLLSVLDEGAQQKKLVDSIIDRCDELVNLRESVLQNRVRYASLALLDDDSSRSYRSKALASLERYFFLITYASFVSESSPTFPTKFSSWLKSRPELGKMSERLRKDGGHFYVFSPIHDLSSIAKGEAGEPEDTTPGAKRKLADARRNGGEVVGDEWARQIVRNRTGIMFRKGMILKNDQWRVASVEGEVPSIPIRGAINFRRVPDSNLYGLSQPTQDAIEKVLENVRQGMDSNGQIVWMNLREEPLIYINGTPYVLRQEAVSLRNVKSYAGITSSRLELLEDRLKSDLLAELKAFDGRLLLHTEAEDGVVNPVWEIVESPESIKTLREVMDEVLAKMGPGPKFSYRRIPITSERSPDFHDVREIVETVAQVDVETSAIIVNCQLGRGRSTRAQILITLVQRWILADVHRFPSLSPDTPRSTRSSYTVINNLLRTIRSGQEVKTAVDLAITACGEVEDLLDSIENAREEAEDAVDEKIKLEKTARGIENLRAYLFLIIFASFLNESKAETWQELLSNSTYESFVKAHPVFKTIERELDTAGLEGLVPLEKPLQAGNALSDEVTEFVAKRSGRILSQNSLLKSDYFAGLQKMSLPERLQGVPNFRRARLLFTADSLANSVSSSSTHVTRAVEVAPVVYGTGMPTVEGLRGALEKMGAQSKLIVWTSLREEPVLYVSGRPHVLRLHDAPLENVVTTGVTANIVELMEAALKDDLLLEASLNNGKILLHDEVQEADGSFTVTATWEEVSPNDLMTPKEVFAEMKKSGLRVDYERLPVTDEQAPIPNVYSRIEERVTAALQLKDEDVGLVFNCQMGRGRTTTGMIAAALIANILFSTSVSDLSGSIVEVDTTPPSHAWDGREADPYLQGEYKIILQLVGVMQHGKLAKKLTDRAIDGMEAVQNLRRAVYDFKLRSEAADPGSSKNTKNYGTGLNYLYRYATLIVFSNYLLEKAGSFDDDEEDERDDVARSLPPFKDWLLERREISHILSRRSLD